MFDDVKKSHQKYLHVRFQPSTHKFQQATKYQNYLKKYYLIILREKMEQEKNQIFDFIKNNPYPDIDGYTKIILNMSQKNSGSFFCIGSSDYNIVKTIYENILDKKVIRRIGCKLHNKGGMEDMVRCHQLLEEIISFNFNKNNENKYDSMIILSLSRGLEMDWNGIGDWLG